MNSGAIITYEEKKGILKCGRLTDFQANISWGVYGLQRSEKDLQNKEGYCGIATSSG